MSIARYGDVLIGCVAKLNRGRAARPALPVHLTRVYRFHEPAFIEAVLRPRGANDELFGVVKLRFERPLRVLRLLVLGQQEHLLRHCSPAGGDLPFHEDGSTPSHREHPLLPLPPAIGQLIDTSLSKGLRPEGCVIADGTRSPPVDHKAIEDSLLELGFRYNGRERMYNGMSSSLRSSICPLPAGLCSTTRILFAGSGLTDANDLAPSGASTSQAGLKIGEMEQWGLELHGSMINLFETTHSDSDHRTTYICRGMLVNSPHSIIPGDLRLS